MTQVELPAMVQERLVDVGLHQVGPRAAIGVALPLLDLLLDLGQTAAVPDVLAPVAQLPRLDNPPAETLLTPLVVLPQEGQVLLVLNAPSHMKSVRKVVILHPLEVEIGLHRFVESLLVADDSTEFKVVRYLMTCYLFCGNLLNVSLMHVLVRFLFDAPPSFYIATPLLVLNLI